MRASIIFIGVTMTITVPSSHWFAGALPDVMAKYIFLCAHGFLLKKILLQIMYEIIHLLQSVYYCLESFLARTQYAN